MIDFYLNLKNQVQTPRGEGVSCPPCGQDSERLRLRAEWSQAQFLAGAPCAPPGPRPTMGGNNPASFPPPPGLSRKPGMLVASLQMPGMGGQSRNSPFITAPLGDKARARVSKMRDAGSIQDVNCKPEIPAVSL